jgi:uracil-DNA glycosylase family 4
MMESNRLRLRAELSKEWLNQKNKHGDMFVPPEQIGLLPIKLMIVGESPAGNEVEQGKPFVGYSGKKVRSKLESYGFRKRGWSVYITNAVKIAKFDLEGRNENPIHSEIDSWRRWLHLEIAAFNPKAVLMLGHSAYYGIMGESVGFIAKTESKCGMKQFVWNEVESNPMLFLTYHPSSLSRVKEYARRYYVDWEAVVKFLRELK